MMQSMYNITLHCETKDIIKVPKSKNELGHHFKQNQAKNKVFFRVHEHSGELISHLYNL